MLRRIILKNFVHFEKEQKLELPSNSPILFVGASSSGKTAVLELIRRCLDSKINCSLTSRANPSHTAYVFCTFSIDATNIICTDLKDYDSKVISGILVDGEQTVGEDDRDKDSIQEITENDGKSSDDGDDDEEKEDQKCDEPNKRYDEDCDQMFHKIIIYTYKNKRKLRSKTYIEKKDGKIVDCQQNVKLPESLFSLLEEGDHEAFVRKVLLYIRTNQKKGNIYDEKPKMWNTISSTFVGVLSMRGMGTFQWTKSEKIAQDYKEDNYQNTCKHAEIINELMGNEVIDDDKEKKIFKYLTDGESIEFTKTSNEGNSDSITIKRGGKSFPLLKTSVGIIEAKQFSLLMAHKELKTICYEEPDRGMHPQMIQRMKEILHRESQESKTIIVVTHSPMLVDSTWLENTFIFCKEDKMYLIKSFDQALPDKNAKLSEIEEMKTLLFSSKVLLVEGKSDKVVLQGIFRHCFIKLASEGNVGDRDKKIISYQILPCGGASFTKPVKEFCDEIKVKCLRLLDRDAVIKIDDQGNITSIKEEGFSSSNKKPISEFICKTKDGFDSLSRKLEEKDIFIWKEGDLEDVLLCDEDMWGDICLTLGVKNDKERQKLKENIKNKLSHGLTREQSERLTEIIMNYEDIQRLLNFLRDS